VTTAYVEQFAMIPGEDGSGPGWLAPRRREAMERFAEFGFPTMKNEDWHFTSPAPIAEATFGPMHPARGSIGIAQLAPYLVDAAWPRLVFVNGRYAPALSRVEGIGPGVRVMSLASALREEPTLLERHLTRVASFDDPALVFTALNTAFMTDGALVHVARDAAPAAPIHLLFVTDDAGAGGVSHPRTLVIVEPNARATLVEQFVSSGDAAYLTNAVTEISVGAGATLQHFRLQREGPRAFHVGTVAATQERDSHFVSFSFAAGASLSRTNIFTALAGEGCGATLNGLYMLDGHQHCDQQTRIEHIRENCYSRELYKGVLDGESHGVFNGKVYVHPEAQKTDGKQTNNTLLLSERARIDTKPQLEIFADDVKCTHGATVGRIDEAALFYMKSRGIPTAEARRLLTYAFAAEVIETIPLEALKVELEGLTLRRFVGAVGDARP
jgi:Fe-S cluster assembly protein SufD